MAANADVVVLWGREFNLVKRGLSEAQVTSFVDELVKQQGAMSQRQQHLEALTKLAERTVTEANKLADETKQDAAAHAKAEGARIVAEAEKRAKEDAARMLSEAETRAHQLLKKKESEAVATATEQMEAMKAAAEILAEEVMKEAREGEARARSEASRVVAEAEAQARRIVKEKESEAVSQAAEQAHSIRAKAEREAGQLLERERQRIQPEVDKFVHRLHDQLLAQLESLKEQVQALKAEYTHGPSRAEEEAPPGKPAGEKGDEFMDFAPNLDHGESGEPDWEIEILPPLDVMKVMNIVDRLDGMAEVARTEIVPRNERTSITVFLRRALDLVEAVRTLPEVAVVEQNGSGADGKPRKISIKLSSQSAAATQAPADCRTTVR